MAAKTPPQNQASRFRNLQAGDPAPMFHQASTANPRYAFDTAAGRYIVLCFYGSAADERGQAALKILQERRGLFDDEKIAFFGVSLDPTDQAKARVAQDLPGVRHFWDFDAVASRLYGAAPEEVSGEVIPVRRLWCVLDPTLRVLATIPFEPDGSDKDAVICLLEDLPPVDAFAGLPLQAPVIYLPNVFEPALCRRLVELYETEGGEPSGFMREEGGRTVLAVDPAHKRRADHIITDETMIRETRGRVLRRIVPEVRKIHQFEATRMERYIVACYSAEDQGHFRAHRDNTTKGTAHRRFAVSINLNDGFEGGELAFPEYGSRTIRIAPGAAVVFSCSLLHAVSPVTAGVRYAFLPFLYDEAAAKLREANSAFLEDGVAPYRA